MEIVHRVRIIVIELSDLMLRLHYTLIEKSHDNKYKQCMTTTRVIISQWSISTTISYTMHILYRYACVLFFISNRTRLPFTCDACILPAYFYRKYVCLQFSNLHTKQIFGVSSIVSMVTLVRFLLSLRCTPHIFYELLLQAVRYIFVFLN